MGHQPETQLAGAREHAGKLLRRMADFARIEADADELVAERQRLLQRLKGFVLAEVPQEAQDQRGGRPSRGASSQARCRPLITVSMAMPRPVWVCGSKNISVCTTLSAARVVR